MHGFEPHTVQNVIGFNISLIKNIVVPGGYICSYSVVVITVDFDIYMKLSANLDSNSSKSYLL